MSVFQPILKFLRLFAGLRPRPKGKPVRLPSSVQPLRFPVTGGENDDFNQAIKAAIGRKAAELAAELKSGATISEDVAGRWLRDHSLTKLKGNFSEASINQLRNALADAWAAGGSCNQLVDAIHGVFPDFSDEEAATIAQTEVNTAYCTSRLAFAHEVGMQEKSWDPDGEACGECQKQIAAGWIPIDEPFPGGVMLPCLHDGCDCIVNFRKTGRADSVFKINEAKINEVKSMIREGREEEAEPVLLGLVAATEQEAQTHGWRVAPWYYERLAIIYRKRREYGSEIAILTRYCQQEGDKFAIKEGIQKRLDRARGLLAKASEPRGNSKAHRQHKGK